MRRRPRNRNQYLYVRKIGPGCWGTCPTATQDDEWLSCKIPKAALWTSSSRTAWCRRPRWIVCPSEPFLGDQKWCNHRERGLDCMKGDREPPTVLIICSVMPGKRLSSWHKWWLELNLGVIILNHTRNDKVSSGSIQGHHLPKNPRPSTKVQERLWDVLLWPRWPLLIVFLQHGTTVNAQHYSQTLTTLCQVIKLKRQTGKLTHAVILLLDNARPHTTNIITSTLAEIQVGGSWSPSLRLYHFWSRKKALRSKQLTSDDDIKQYVQNWFTTSLRNFTKQIFTPLCHSGTSASTARANTFDIQVQVSVPRPLAYIKC